MNQSVRKAITLLRATAEHGEAAPSVSAPRPHRRPPARDGAAPDPDDGGRAPAAARARRRPRGARSGAVPARAGGGHGRRAARARSRASGEPREEVRETVTFSVVGADGGLDVVHQEDGPQHLVVALVDRAALPPPRQLERQGPARELRRGARWPASCARPREALTPATITSSARAAPRARGGPRAGLRRPASTSSRRGSRACRSASTATPARWSASST